MLAAYLPHMPALANAGTLPRLVIAFAALVPLDLLLCRRSGKARWLLLHSIANVVICAFAWHDLLSVLYAPAVSCVGRPSSEVPPELIVALHAYHLAFFKCTAADLFHHLVFVGLLGSLSLYFDAGPLVNFGAFFICGLPGAIDMLMVAAVKHGLLLAATEKVWNARINVWVRSPGLVVCGFCLWLAIAHGPDSSCVRHPRIAAAVGFLAFANGQFYMQQVAGNAYRKVPGLQVS